MTERMKQALSKYAQILREDGLEAADAFQRENAHLPEFDRWATAVRIVLRAEELLEASD